LVLIWFQATPKLSEDKIKQCVDPKLRSDYPAKAVAKVQIECSMSLSVNHFSLSFGIAHCPAHFISGHREDINHFQL
jgi:hypothetical protein